MRQAGRQAGFTLLEVLVGLVVLGFILAGLAGGVRYGLRASDTQARLSAGRGELDAVDRTLRRLIAQADPGTAHSGPVMRGTPSRFSLVSRLPDAVAGFVTKDADVAIVLTPGHALEMRWTPHLHAVRFGAPPAVQEATLLQGVDKMDVSYWSGTWRSDWTGNGLPVLVRIRLVFPKGDIRHWPDIVAATMRHPAG